MVVLSLASGGADRQVQLSGTARQAGTGIQIGLKNHGIIRKKVRRKNLGRSRWVYIKLV